MESDRNKLDILFLEDTQNDVEIVEQKLKDDFPCRITLDSAGNEQEYLSRIFAKRYDVILADYTLPGFNAEAALRLRQLVCPDVPFICVSGTIGEDVAVELLKQGATDYVLKDRLGRLSFAMLRALESAGQEKANRQAELLLRETVRRLQEAESVTHVGSAEWDAVNDVLVLSDEAYRIYGLDPKAADVKPGIAYTGMDEADRQRVSAAWARSAGEKAPLDETYWITRPDGEKRCIRLRVSPKVDAGGRLTALTGSMQDITELKRAEEESRKRIETETRLNMMTEFFTNVSHELKTPLSLILMQIDMMRMHLGNEKRMRELMADATLNAYRLTRLVSNLLDITKMDAGFLMFNARNRDIVPIIRSICESVQEFALAKEITLAFSSDMESRLMDLDSDKLERSVLNLLSNAIKHTPPGGKITVELKGGDHTITIGVADTGEGIPKDKLATVFERFIQVNSNMNSHAEGAGIGLTLVKSMVELHGGRVWAESEWGKGSRFVIELPVVNSGLQHNTELIESFDLSRKVRMELSDLYIRESV